MNDVPEFKALPIDDLLELPSKLQDRRARTQQVASLLTAKLNEYATKGWELVTTYRGSDLTIFVFRRMHAKTG